MRPEKTLNWYFIGVGDVSHDVYCWVGERQGWKMQNENGSQSDALVWLLWMRKKLYVIK